MTRACLAEGTCFSMVWCFGSEREKNGHVYLRWFGSIDAATTSVGAFDLDP